MLTTPRTVLISGIFAILLFSCKSQPPNPEYALSVLPVESPAAPGSALPNLFATDDGKSYLSWVEDLNDGVTVLKMSAFQSDGWSMPKTIASGDDWFVNWADFPSIAALDDGTLAAHWLAKSGDGTYAYDVNIAFSKNGGETWSVPTVPHKDGTQTEHGFASLLPWQNDKLFAVWLDGRNFAGSGGHGDASEEMTLRFASLYSDGTTAQEQELDDRTCECCQTSAGILPDGAIVAYRNRSTEEIRDIYVVRLENGAWSEPQRVFEDNWKIPGCPVNGPSLATMQNTVAIAWFTAAEQNPQVKLAFSKDGGKTFGAPVQVHDGEPLGRVDVILLDQSAALVSWMEYQGDDAAIKIRRISPDGVTDDTQTIAVSGGSRASGFPRMVKAGNTIHFAWTKTGEPSQVMTAMAQFQEK